MCDPELIAEILTTLSSYFDVLSIDSPVAISSLSLEELGYFDEKKEKVQKDEVHEEGRKEDHSKNSEEEEQK